MPGPHTPRPRHAIKEIDAALRAVEAMGWQVETSKGGSAHARGFVLCPANARDACRSGTFCRMSVWSTPRNPQAHARDLVRKAARCVMKDDADGD